MRIVIEMEGGLITNVYTIADGETNSAVIVDYDTDYVSEDADVTTARCSDGGLLTACIHTQQPIKFLVNSDLSKLLEAYDTANRS